MKGRLDRVSLEEFIRRVDLIASRCLDRSVAWAESNEEMSRLYYDEFHADPIPQPYSDALGDVVAALLVDECDDEQFRLSEDELRRKLGELRRVQADVAIRGVDALRAELENVERADVSRERARLIEKHRRGK